VEARNFDIRKNILKYDDVMNDQRKAIFSERIELMDSEDVEETIGEMRHAVIDNLLTRFIPERAYPEQWQSAELTEAAKTYLNLDVPIADWAHEEGIDVEIIRERMTKMADDAAAAKVERFTPDIMRQVEKSILLQSIDGLWREHLVTLDHLSKVVGWRGLAQRDPLNEYKQEAYELFQALLTNLRELVTTQLSHIEIQVRQPQTPPIGNLDDVNEIHIDPMTGLNEVEEDDLNRPGSAAAAATMLAAAGISTGAVAEADPALKPIDPKLLVGVSRNAPCPCGSGKKFKHCHGQF
jgi:preprotein translocase subunit SecA